MPEPRPGAAAPAQIAKGALRRLAMAQQEPTPENYARAYAEESGQAAALLPERARPLIERMVSRWAEDADRREALTAALMHGRWDQVAQALDRGSQSGAAQAQAWAQMVDRLVRALERGSRQWTSARKKESLQRVLDGSRSDLQRLQQRLTGLVSAWESDQPLPPDDDAAGVAEAPPAVVDGAKAAASVSPSATAHPAGVSADWQPALHELHGTLAAGLPDEDLRAAELADRLRVVADSLAADGPDAERLRQLSEVCAEIRRLFGHRQHLMQSLGQLCQELGQGLSELAEDESWAQGQALALQARLADGVNVRSVRAASEILSDARQRHARVRSERDQARDALKQLIHRMLEELGELGEQTGRFHDSVGRHAQAIEAADSLEDLAGVVRELVDDSRSVQSLVRQAQARMNAEHERGQQLEAQVRQLEGELRRLSEEVSTDALTQVANRRGLALAFEREAARTTRSEAPAVLSVGLIDIDNFKKLNDTLGHAAGDKALQALARSVRERLRPTDHLARFGGEEFVVLLPDTVAADAQQLLTRLQRALSAALFMHDDREVFVTFSAGVTAWRPGEPLEAAMQRADEALYEAKRTGKNRTCAA